MQIEIYIFCFGGRKMESEYKKVGEYKVKEVYNENGKKIQEILADVFKSYCKENMEKEIFGQTFNFIKYIIIIIIYLKEELIVIERRKNDNNK